MLDVSYGDGTITPRKDGRLQVAVVVAGKRRYAMIPAGPKQKQRAEAKRRELHAQREAGLDPSAQTLGDFLDGWIVSLHKRVRPRTLDHYSMIVAQHIKPALGRHRLDRLTERHVQTWIDSDPAAPRTVAHHRAVLRRALNSAVRQRIVGRNVARDVEMPPIPDYRGKPLTLEEASRLLAATKDDRLGAAWRLAIDTGLREMELLGLPWDDIDLDAGTLTVRRQLVRRQREWRFDKPKAGRDLETISLAADTVSALRRHQIRQADERQTSWRYFGLAFVTERGDPYQPAAFLREFHRACDKAGISRRRFHDLRGSNATLMRQLGVPEDLRMARLGHSTTTMARHYAQAGTGIDREAAETLATALREAK